MAFSHVIGEGAKAVVVSALAAYVVGIITGAVGAFWIDIFEPLVSYYDKEVRDRHVPHMLVGMGVALCLVVPYIYAGGWRIGLATWCGVTIVTAIYAWKRGAMQIELEYILFSLTLGLWGFAALTGAGRISISIVRGSRV